MKHNAMPPFILAFTLGAFGLITSPLSLANTSNKADNKRWFEIEVILFQQSAKFSEQAEEFFPEDLTLKKQRALDLLAPYLQPDIKALKQFVPSCEQVKVDDEHFPYNVAIQPQVLWFNRFSNNAVSPASADSTYTITDTDTDNTVKHNIDTPNTAANTLSAVDSQSADSNLNVRTDLTPRSNLTLANDSSTVSAPIIADENNTPFTKQTAITSEVSVSETHLTETHQYQVQSTEENSTVIVPREKQEDGYQVKYANIALENYSKYPTSTDNGLCIIPSDIILKQQSAEQLKSFNIDGFPIEKQPTVINGIEQWQDDENGEIKWASDSPYLISQDSLRLKSIANRIKRSRNYKPLLHVGWRQVGENIRRAKAVRLYAGENLDLNYQQALTAQNEEQQAIAQQAIFEQEKEALLAEILAGQQGVAPDSILEHNQQKLDAGKTTLLIEENALSKEEIEEKVRQHAQQQQLDNIFEQYNILAQLEQSQDNSNSHVSVQALRYNEQDVKRIIDQLSADITEPNPSLVLTSNTNDLTIKPPIQPWYLDGLFKVHLDHYLYINSEFNLLDSNKKPYGSTKGNSLPEPKNIINFKQDRRVITGEIHYFDHPHIGMVVQIRRFDPTKPAAEAVTQSKK